MPSSAAQVLVGLASSRRACARARCGPRRCPRAPARSSRATPGGRATPSPRSASSSPTSVLQQRGLARAVEAEHEHPLAAADVEASRPRTRSSGRTPSRGRRPRARPGPRAAARAAARAPCDRPAPRSTRFALSFSTRWSSVLAIRARFSVWPRIESASALQPRRSRASWRAASFVAALLVGLPRDEVLRVRAAVLDELALVEVQHARDRLVEQLEVVADHEQRAAVRPQELHEPLLGVDVEVVRRLVEQQEVAAREQDARELDAPPLTAGERGDREVEPVGGRGRARRRCAGPRSRPRSRRALRNASSASL